MFMLMHALQVRHEDRARRSSDTNLAMLATRTRKLAKISELNRYVNLLAPSKDNAINRICIVPN